MEVFPAQLATHEICISPPQMYRQVTSLSRHQAEDCKESEQLSQPTVLWEPDILTDEEELTEE